ncbi:MAG: nucleotidyltransferase domain-containing protein [Patescibacteria group bacterium]|nr:nucleotidyltransferase domain-containing protein [Patescibacteria group bacterium]MDE2439222.1 nucleotidyltransferase domain-containing protein [Patescibacteria group bacterium]
MSEAFLTGSYAYGTPTDVSDIDIVLYLSNEQLSNFEKVFPVTKINDGRYMSRAGILNFIICLDHRDYNSWKTVTDSLISQKPVTRKYAIENFNKAGLTGYDR